MRAWASANRVTGRLRKQLRLTNKREGHTVVRGADICRMSSKVLRRKMATKLTRLIGLHAAVEMGEWSSEAVAKLYVDEADVLATATYNPTDAVLQLGNCAGEALEASEQVAEGGLPALQSNPEDREDVPLLLGRAQDEEEDGDEQGGIAHLSGSHDEAGRRH